MVMQQKRSAFVFNNIKWTYNGHLAYEDEQMHREDQASGYETTHQLRSVPARKSSPTHFNLRIG